MRRSVYALTINILGLLTLFAEANHFQRNLAYDTPFVGRPEVWQRLLHEASTGNRLFDFSFHMM